MNLNCDLVPAILQHIDCRTSSESQDPLSIEGSDEETVSDHLRLLEAQGYVVSVPRLESAHERRMLLRITSRGSGFLARSRSDAVWARAKKKVEEHVVGTAKFKLELLSGLLETAEGNAGDPTT
jgi:DNA-binding MarR family transcriptional regulator